MSNKTILAILLPTRTSNTGAPPRFTGLKEKLGPQLKKSALAMFAFATALSAGQAMALNGTNPKAMTWASVVIPQNKITPRKIPTGIHQGVNKHRIVIVGCHGSNQVSCDAYKGDTAETASLPILCFVPGNIAMPAQYRNHYNTHGKPNWEFYYGWSGGQVGLTKPVAGDQITSRAVADNRCKSAANGLGDPNARMIEFHDNGVGGWGLGAVMHPRTKKRNWLKKPVNHQQRRFWASIDDQRANPWD